jgi:hypothetical protein
MTEPFTFGIPLIARASSGNWPLVEHLFELTLRSVQAQSDADFRVLLAAHDVPAIWQSVAADPRFVLLQADWPAEQPTVANDDGGRKKWLIKQTVRRSGGGLLMFLDADDWVSSDLVETARSTMEPGDVGAIVGEGYALDHASLRVQRFPIAGAFAGEFHELCGSSTIGRVVPDSSELIRLDPHAALGSHHQWLQSAVEQNVSLARLTTLGMYLVGTGQNHSEEHGPNAGWRKDVTAAVRQSGVLIDASLAAEFGQRSSCLAVESAQHHPEPLQAARLFAG